MNAKALKFCYDLETSHGLPFIDMIEGNLKGMCFLIDSGSTECVVFKGCVESFPEKFTQLENKGTVWGVGAIPYETGYVMADVEFCGRPNKVPFQVIDDTTAERLYAETGITMHGVLGTNFMQANNMLIDFVNQRVLVASESFRETE